MEDFKWFVEKLNNEKTFLESQLKAWQNEKGSEHDKQNLKVYNSTDMFIHGYEEKIKMVEKFNLIIMKEMLKMELQNKFWTSEKEMIDDIETNYSYDVVDIDYEYIELTPQDGWEDETITFKLIRANNTIAIQ